MGKASAAQGGQQAKSNAPAGRSQSLQEAQDSKGGPRQPNAGARRSPRAESKKALLIAMLSTQKGATIDALIKATGWLPHTTRAALTGLRKGGHAIVRFRDGDGVTAYKIENGASVDIGANGRSRRQRRSTGESVALSPAA